MNGGDADIAKIIDLNGDAFAYIKEVRDAVAHGDNPGMPGRDFTRIITIITKVELLLTYWAFIDFGLTKDDFLKCLTRTRNRMRFAAQLDEVHLARVTMSAEFFTVPEAKFQEFSMVKNIQVNSCFILPSNGEIQYSERYTKMQWDWIRSSASRKAGIYTNSDIFGVPNDAVRYIANAYVESGAKNLQISSMYLFDPTKLPSS